MKNILFLVFVVGCIPSTAQRQPLITILSYHGDVTLGGHPVAAGQVVFDDGRNLLIGGQGSYATILTETGYAQKLRKGNYSPVLLNNEPADIKRQTSSVRESPPIAITTAPDPPYVEIFGDSVFLLWKGTSALKVVPPFTVSISTMFDDRLLDTLTQQSYCALPVGSVLLQERSIIIQVRSSFQNMSLHSHYFPVKKMLDDDHLRVQNELQILAATTETERAIARIAIFDINDLIYDVTYGLYKLRMAEKAAGVRIVNNYYQRQLKKYGMETL
jgi:hypothetical protein